MSLRRLKRRPVRLSIYLFIQLISYTGAFLRPKHYVLQEFMGKKDSAPVFNPPFLPRNFPCDKDMGASPKRLVL